MTEDRTVPRRIMQAGYPNPLHEDHVDKYRRYLRRAGGNHDLAFKALREDTHPAFQGMFDSSETPTTGDHF